MILFEGSRERASLSANRFQKDFTRVALRFGTCNYILTHPLMPNYLEQNLFSGSSSDNSQSGALPITYT